MATGEETERAGARTGKIAFRAAKPWTEWLARLAAYCDCDAAELVAQAIHRHAEGIGFTEAPPPRLTRQGATGAALARRPAPGQGGGDDPEPLSRLARRKIRDAAEAGEPWALRILARAQPPTDEPTAARNPLGGFEPWTPAMFSAVAEAIDRAKEGGDEYPDECTGVVRCPKCAADVSVLVHGTYRHTRIEAFTTWPPPKVIPWWDRPKAAGAESGAPPTAAPSPAAEGPPLAAPALDA